MFLSFYVLVMVCSCPLVPPVCSCPLEGKSQFILAPTIIHGSATCPTYSPRRLARTCKQRATPVYLHCFTSPTVEVFPVLTVQRAFAQDALKCDTPYLFGLDDIRLEYLDIGLDDVSFECLDIGLADVEFAGIKPSHLIKS